MPWIKVHHSIRDHRKIISAAESLRIPEPQVIGHMILIWLWAVENAPDGQLRVSDAVIARVAGWTRPVKTFVDVLVSAEFLTRLDRVGCAIVNFEEHILPVIIANRKNTKRQEEFRRRSSSAPPSELKNDPYCRKPKDDCECLREVASSGPSGSVRVTVT